MNKGDLIAQVMKMANLTKKDASAAVDAVFDAIVESLKKGDAASFVGFGSFKVTQRQEREGRNPKTGEIIKIPSMGLPRFVAGKSFKDAVNSK